MTIHLHHGDLPQHAYDALMRTSSLAIDTEAMGLNIHGDRLCLIQICDGAGVVHLVRFDARRPLSAPHVVDLLSQDKILKIFHFARFDIALIYKTFGIVCQNIYCTKMASRLVRTYTERHGLKELCRELLGVEISKVEQTSDWGTVSLTQQQCAYAAKDVLYLHALKEKLDYLLEREGRHHLMHANCAYIPTRALLDAYGWAEDMFAH